MMTQQVPAGMIAQTLHIPAGRGIDQATREEYVQPGAANLLSVNTRIVDRDALEKRKGFTTLSYALTGHTASGYTSRPDGIKMFAHDKQTCVIDDDGNLDTHLWDKSTNALQTRVPRLSTETVFATHCGDPLSRGDVEFIDIAICNGFYFLCSWEYNGTNRQAIVHVLDKDTRAVLKTVRTGSGTTYTYGSFLKLVTVGTTAYLAYTSTNVIRVMPFDCSSMAALETSLNNFATGAGATTVATDWNNLWLDICGMSTMFAIAYINNSGGANAVTVKTFTAATMTPATSATVNTGAAPVGCAIDGSESDYIWLAYVNSSGTAFVQGHDPANVANIASTATSILGLNALACGITIRRTTSTGGYVAGNGLDSTGTWYTATCSHFYSDGGLTTYNLSTPAPTENPGFVVMSQPFVLGNYVYINCGFYEPGTVRSPNVCLFKIGDISSATGAKDISDEWIPCGSPQRGNAVVGLTVMGTIPSHVPYIDSYGAAYVMAVATNAAEGAICITEARTDKTELLYHKAEHNGRTYLSGAQVYAYDGVRAVEAGFVCPPSISAASLVVGAGLEVGTYIYTAIHQWCDAYGNVEWSEPAAVKTITTTSGSQRVSVRILGFKATAKNTKTFSATYEFEGRRVRTLLFRTKVGGGVFYLHSTYLLGATTTTITDSTSDAVLGAGRKLYTQPGMPGAAQSRRCPPSAKHIGTYNDMLIVIADDGRTIWPSGQRVVGEAAWWGDAFQIAGAAGLVCSMEMDGSLYIFSRDSIYALSGEAPSDNGLAGGLGTPRRVSSSAGCVDARSLVRTELGIFFRSERGIELLGRDGSVVFVGEQVYREVDACPYTTSAVLDVRNNVVIFTLAKQQTGGIVYPTPAGSPEVSYSRRLVFDLSSGVWCSLDKMHGITSSHDVTAQSADIVWNETRGEYVYAWQEGYYYGVVHVESDSYVDAGAYEIVSEWSTPWIKLEAQADHQFYQGVLRVERDGTVGLEVDCYYDWSSTIDETKTWTSAEMSSYPKQVEIRPKPARQAVRFVMRDTYPSSPGGDANGGLNFIGLSMDIGLFKGPQQGVPRIAVGARK